ncbi:helix-turn-helix domain-containing protein [Cohnella boryungensis]|uniref:Helix-turn-helix domain-containing protein n=1 Tax=Cohnella boryungensis TaxID=768479 RepID=A0ABV8S7Y0_9BACL
MDLKPLREDRRHGTPEFPFATYEQERMSHATVLDTHWHEEAEFIWMTSGQAQFQIGMHNYRIGTGEALFIPSGEIHGGYPLEEESCSYRAIVFHPEWLTGSRDGIAAQYLKPLQRGEAVIPSEYDELTPWGKLALQRLTHLYLLFESEDEAKEIRVKAELYLLFADLISAGQWKLKDPASVMDTHTIDRLKAVVAHIEKHCGLPLSVSELARVAGMSAGHFSRVFKTFMRKTPMEYVNQFRIRQAAYMLQNSDFSVAEVALEVGLSNFSYFSKTFKSVYGCTPSAYRKKFRNL